MGSENINLCRVCHSEFETEEELSLHTCLQIKQEFQDSNYDVDQNDAQDSRDYELPSNENINMDVEKPALNKKPKKLCICGICTKSFKDDYRLRRHVSQVHTKDGEIIQPDQGFKAKTEIETRDAKKLCICGICNKSFKDNYKLRRHVSQVHTKDWKIIQPDQVFEPKTKIETKDFKDVEFEKPAPNKDAQYFKEEEQFDFEYTDIDLSEELLSEILRLVDELCDVINRSDPDLYRTVKVNKIINDAVSCYRNKLVSIDSKIDAFAETKQQGHFLKDLLHYSENQEFENYNADMDYNPNVSKAKKRKKIPKKNNTKTSSKVSTNCNSDIEPKEKRKSFIKNPDDIFLYPYVKYIRLTGTTGTHETEVQCLCCNAYTQRKALVFRHLRTVHKSEIDWNKGQEKIYDCETRVCKNLYGSWFKQLWCTQCIVLAKMKRKESQRKRKTGPNRVKYYQLCPDCGKNVENLSQHMKQHITEEHKCSQCDTVLKHLQGLKDHVKSVHEKEPCVECGRLISHKNMKLHLQGHAPDSEKKYKCDVCGKGFTETQRLQDHMNVHTGEKPYKCKYCTNCFASRGNQRMHERGHEGYRRNHSK
jgi:uncharacterized Zn-finger protein